MADFYIGDKKLSDKEVLDLVVKGINNDNNTEQNQSYSNVIIAGQRLTTELQRNRQRYENVLYQKGQLERDNKKLYEEVQHKELIISQLLKTSIEVESRLRLDNAKMSQQLIDTNNGIENIKQDYQEQINLHKKELAQIFNDLNNEQIGNNKLYELNKSLYQYTATLDLSLKKINDILHSDKNCSLMQMSIEDILKEIVTYQDSVLNTSESTKYNQIYKIFDLVYKKYCILLEDKKKFAINGGLNINGLDNAMLIACQELDKLSIEIYNQLSKYKEEFDNGK